MVYWKELRIAIVLLIMSATAWICLNMAQSTGAGIGPAGFAKYARQGIISENCKIYGGCKNSPWSVTCTEVPSFRTISDTITCHVRLK